MSGTAVLLSGGLDSAVLLADEATRGEVQPIYVSVGLAWESGERAMVSRFLAHSRLGARVHPLVSLSVDMRDVYRVTAFCQSLADEVRDRSIVFDHQHSHNTASVRHTPET